LPDPDKAYLNICRCYNAITEQDKKNPLKFLQLSGFFKTLI